MSSPLTRHLPDVHDALQVAHAELRYHATRLREAARLAVDAHGTRARQTQHLLRTAEEYDAAAATTRRLMVHVAKRARAAQGAPLDPTAISLHGHARAHTSDDIASLDSPDAIAPHGHDVTTPAIARED